MADDEQDIRDLIERWATAVHAGDMATVLADHAADIVMFDVPPPEQGVRGIAAYEETWPGFFAWQASGGSFEIESLEVTAGSDVAFAHAGLDWKRHVKTDPRFVRPAEVDTLQADPSKAKRALGWTPRTSFADLVRMMVDADLERLS